MIFITNNQILKLLKFDQYNELETYISNNKEIKKILLDRISFGENYYCILCYDSLYHEKQFLISFSSDSTYEKINIYFWSEYNFIIIGLLRQVFIINSSLQIVKHIELNAFFTNFYVHKNKTLLIFDSTSVSFVDSTGNLICHDLDDLIIDYKLQNDAITISTDSTTKTFFIP